MLETLTGQGSGRLRPRFAARQAADLGANSPGYDGPVFVVTSDAIAPENGFVPVHAADLLGTVTRLSVPIVYLPSGQEPVAADDFPAGQTVTPEQVQSAGGVRGYLQEMARERPQAQIFTLGSNVGSDPKATGLPGMTNYLRNADPRQSNMPRHFEGILTDEYFDEFDAKVAHDLTNARLSSASLGGDPAVRSTLPVASYLPPPQRVGPLAFHQIDKVESMATDAMGLVAAAFRHQFRNVQQSLDLAAAPLETLGSTPRLRLGQALNDLAAAMGTDSSDKILRLLTSHGTRPGQIDSILSCAQNPGLLADGLQGQAQWSYQALRSDGAPRPGDFSGFNQYLDDLTGTKVSANNGVKFLVNGDQAFPRLMDAINHAQKFINLSTFTFNSDQTGREVVAALEKAAARGVKITMLVDPNGSSKQYQLYAADPHLFDNLKKMSNVQFIETSSPMANHCNHRKITTMDNGTDDGGQLAFTGGMNIGNDYRLRWHDVNSEVTGPVVTDLNRLIIEQTERFGGSIEAGLKATMLAPQKEVKGGSDIRVVGHVGKQDHDLKMAWLRAINTAQDSIDIADPYISDPDILKALAERARNGVKVRLVVPQNNNHMVMKWALRAHYNELLAAGVEIFEYQGREMAHDKVGVFDQKLTTIGSCNLDARSLANNDEANIWSLDPRLAREVTQRLFDADVLQSTQVRHYQPTILTGTQDSITRLFEPSL